MYLRIFIRPDIAFITGFQAKNRGALERRSENPSVFTEYCKPLDRLSDRFPEIPRRLSLLPLWQQLRSGPNHAQLGQWLNSITVRGTNTLVLSARALSFLVNIREWILYILKISIKPVLHQSGCSDNNFKPWTSQTRKAYCGTIPFRTGNCWVHLHRNMAKHQRRSNKTFEQASVWKTPRWNFQDMTRPTILRSLVTIQILLVNSQNYFTYEDCD